jgi:pimeloyl-ACP methyl ester carboxylesterase
MAAEYPEIIKDRTVAFACIATSPGIDPAGQLVVRRGLGQATARAARPGRLRPAAASAPSCLTNLLKANRDLEEFLVERYSFASPVPRSVVRLTAKMILGTDLGVMSDFVPTFDAYDKTAALPYFAHCETLVFNGTQDVLTPPEHSEIIVRAIAGCRACPHPRRGPRHHARAPRPAQRADPGAAGAGGQAAPSTSTRPRSRGSPSSSPR